MSRSASLAAYLRAAAWRRLDRVETNDGDRNARSALALLDAAAYAAGLPEDDPLILRLVEAGCFHEPDGFGSGPAGERFEGAPGERYDPRVPGERYDPGMPGERFDPGVAGERLVRGWPGGEPHELLMALPPVINAGA